MALALDAHTHAHRSAGMCLGGRNEARGVFRERVTVARRYGIHTQRKKNWKVIQVDEQVELEGIRRHRTSVTLANWIGDRTSVLDRGRRSRHINVQRSTPGAYDARYACHRPPACLMACTIPQGRTSSRTSVVNMLQDSECTSISWEFKTGLNQQIPI